MNPRKFPTGPTVDQTPEKKPEYLVAQASYFGICWDTPLKTNMLEDVSPTEIVPFWGTCWIWRVFLFVRRGEVPKI